MIAVLSATFGYVLHVGASSGANYDLSRALGSIYSLVEREGPPELRDQVREILRKYGL